MVGFRDGDDDSVSSDGVDGYEEEEDMYDEEAISLDERGPIESEDSGRPKFDADEADEAKAIDPSIAMLLSIGCFADASSDRGTGKKPSHAVDGDPSTRWSSWHEDNQWLRVDLGATYLLHRIEIRWDAAYASEYLLEGSIDRSAWHTMARVKGHEGAVVTLLPIGSKARWVRMMGLTRALAHDAYSGFSIYDFNVYGIGSHGMADSSEPMSSPSFPAPSSSWSHSTSSNPRDSRTRQGPAKPENERGGPKIDPEVRQLETYRQYRSRCSDSGYTDTEIEEYWDHEMQPFSEVARVPRSSLRCAGRGCHFLVHPREELGTFCCLNCWAPGGKHGPRCLHELAPDSAVLMAFDVYPLAEWKLDDIDQEEAFRESAESHEASSSTQNQASASAVPPGSSSGPSHTQASSRSDEAASSGSPSSHTQQAPGKKKGPRAPKDAKVWEVKETSRSCDVLYVYEDKEGRRRTGDPTLGLTIGSLVKEIEIDRDHRRLHYELLSGEGPDSGWVTISVGTRACLVCKEPMQPSAASAHPPAGSHAGAASSSTTGAPTSARTPVAGQSMNGGLRSSALGSSRGQDSASAHAPTARKPAVPSVKAREAPPAGSKTPAVRHSAQQSTASLRERTAGQPAVARHDGLPASKASPKPTSSPMPTSPPRADTEARAQVMDEFDEDLELQKALLMSLGVEG